MNHNFPLETVARVEAAAAELAMLLTARPEEERALIAQYLGARMAATLEETIGPRMGIAFVSVMVEGWLTTAATPGYCDEGGAPEDIRVFTLLSGSDGPEALASTAKMHGACDRMPEGRGE